MLGALALAAEAGPQERSTPVKRVAPLAKGEHVRPQAGGEAALVQAGLRGVTLDLSGVTLRGQLPGGNAHLARGVGVVLRDCHDVTVLGGTLGGFETCLVIEDSSDVRVEGSRFEGWYAPLLGEPTEGGPALPAVGAAGGAAERQGLAVLVRRSQRVSLRELHGRGGESGVRIESSSDCSVLDSDLSFLARHGVAVWDSSGCTVARNRLDYCLRDDGHLAAGVVLVQGRDHVVALNRATHCQRGIADLRGSGNLMWRNDVSHAREAGVELVACTGVRVLENLIGASGGDGVRAISSERIAAAANQIEDAAGSGLRLESCRGGYLVRNVLHGANIGVQLLSLAPQDGTPGPCEDSGEHTLWGNSFTRNALDLMITRTGELMLQDNVFSGSGGLFAKHLAAVERTDLTREELLMRVHGVAGSKPSGNLSSCTLRAPGAEPPAELMALLHPKVPRKLVDGELPPPRSRSGPDSVFMGIWGPLDYE